MKVLKTLTRLGLKHKKAARLLAEDRMSIERVAGELGINVETLRTWRNAPAFQAQVREYQAEIEAAVSQIPYAKKADRIQLLSDSVSKYTELRDKRGKWYTEKFPDVPGGSTGLLVHSETVKGVGAGQVHIDEHKVDNGLESLLQTALVQIAKERGEFSDSKPTQQTVIALVPITEIEVALPEGPPADRDED
jgi:hypothetical protein